MKKLLTKDKSNRIYVKNLELKHFILKQITTNSNFIKTIRWNAINKLIYFKKKSSKTYLSNRCVKTFNRKIFHKFSNFSRTVFLKFAKNGLISNLKKSCW